MTSPPSRLTIRWIRSQQRALWRYLRLLGAGPDEVEDLMQDAFVALLGQYRGHEEAAQVRLLRTIARNRFLEVRRRQRRDVSSWTDAVDGWLQRQPAALTDEHSEHVHACLRELSERARTGLIMHHVEDRSVDDVARQLGLRRSGASTLLQRSRDLLRSCLARHGLPRTLPLLHPTKPTSQEIPQ